MRSAPTSSANKFAQAILPIAFVLTLLGYWNALANGFVYDDNWQIVLNPLIKQPSLFKVALTSDVWAFRTGDFSAASNYYRPVFTAWTILNYALFEQNPMGWHITSILLHFVAVCLLWRVLLKLKAKPAVAAVVTWIFAAHPAHVESVTWIAGATDLLMAVFGLFAFLKWLEVRESQTPIRWALALGSFFLAMGSKEVSIGLALVILVTEWALRREAGQRNGWVNGIRAATPFLAVGIFFICIRVALIGKGVAVQQSIGWLGMLLSTPQLWSFYLRQTFWPFDLSTAYPIRGVTRETLSLTNFWLPAVAGLMSAVGLIWMATKRALWTFGAAMVFFLLIPAFYIRAFHFEHIVRDRYLYLPLSGAFLLLVDGVATRWPKLASKEMRSPVSLAGLAVAMGFAILSMLYNPVWKNDISFWTRGVETDPSSSTAAMNLGEGLRKGKDLENAIRYATKATELAPNLARPWTILGMAYRDAGDMRQAEITLRHALSVKQDVQIAGENLGAMLASQGRTDEAAAVYRELIEVAPSTRLINEQSIAIILFNAGRRDSALSVLESTKTELNRSSVPQVQRNWFFLGELYRERGRADLARESYRRFLERSDPSDTSLAAMRQQASVNIDQ